MQKVSIALTCILIMSLLCGCGSVPSKTVETAVTSQPISEKADEVLSTELFSDENATKVNLSEITGNYTITAPGTYSLEGNLNGQIEITVSKETKVKLILNGVEITNNDASAIYVTSADKVIISSAKDTVNNISSTGSFGEDEKVDAAVFSKDDLTFNGEGTINISSTKHGIVSKNDLKLNGGTVNITSSKKGAEGKDSIEVKAGTYTIESGNFCLESEGDVSILGGELNLTSQNKDGIKATLNTVISDGTVNIIKSKEGIEAQTVTIAGGEVSILSTDDGINASTADETGDVAALKIGPPDDRDENASVNIDGGKLTIVAGGDGIDSNGYIKITGGKINISTPSGNGDSALDYGIEGTVTGGTVFAFGDGGMAEIFTEQETQGFILYNFGKNYAADTKVSLLDSSDNELLSANPVQSFSSVFISNSETVKGKSFKLVVGEDVFEITMESNSYAVGAEGFNKQGGMPGGNRPGDSMQFESHQIPDGSMPPNGSAPPDGQKPPEGLSQGQPPQNRPPMN